VAQESAVSIDIIEAREPLHLDTVRSLFREYFQSLAIDHGLEISYQGIDDELATLPGDYAPPQGRLVLAVLSSRSVGCAALRPLAPTVCELKRMYVPPLYRAQGVGRALALALIQQAREIGYIRVRLDTATFLTAAMRLYESLGFRPMAPYNEIPEHLRRVAVHMELELT
jgi:GNAT superfamily N-acetyltransferase